MTSLSVFPLKYSITRNTIPPSASPKSVTLKAFGCEIREATLASREKRATIFSSAAREVRSTLTATVLSIKTCVPRYTVPMPPSLKRSSIRYFPARTLPRRSSPVFSSATPSDGQRVFVSGYSTPHFGHIFIWDCASLKPVGGKSIVSLTHRLEGRQSDIKNANEAQRPR